MPEVGYLYFSKVDYDFIRQHFPDIFAICEQYVSSREPDIELTVTDSQTDMIDNKVLMAIGSSATAPYGNPSLEAIELEAIWDRA
ncbi:hypothetical protein QUW35_10700 [Ligilactobacillus agilis]|uniref:hypothetical protein n=1 Tax=Ligilactobacillus agilis TaxID=1601 RepID=UPI0025A3B1C5|nr:hypothetical protein [Ligilactobacillus agilis]MDM8281129.1 hypothetical protein [Ligilactobacillus agilis]